MARRSMPGKQAAKPHLFCERVEDNAFHLARQRPDVERIFTYRADLPAEAIWQSVSGYRTASTARVTRLSDRTSSRAAPARSWRALRLRAAPQRSQRTLLGRSR